MSRQSPAVERIVAILNFFIEHSRAAFTLTQVAKSLRGLVLPADLAELPKRGEKLLHGDREVGFITSAVASPAFQKNIALAYVRREHHEPGTVLQLQIGDRALEATIVPLPFRF